MGVPNPLLYPLHFLSSHFKISSCPSQASLVGLLQKRKSLTLPATEVSSPINSDVLTQYIGVFLAWVRCGV